MSDIRSSHLLLGPEQPPTHPGLGTFTSPPRPTPPPPAPTPTAQCPRGSPDKVGFGECVVRWDGEEVEGTYWVGGAYVSWIG